MNKPNKELTVKSSLNGAMINFKRGSESNLMDVKFQEDYYERVERLAPSLLWANHNGFEVSLSTLREHYTIFTGKSQLISVYFSNIFQEIFELTYLFFSRRPHEIL